ncbi:2OG-Fe(II) oxygenase [Glaciecola sp. MH2013]|nr:2OG-Fe(II) oxygenase [Glaciecola sp. MH2013]MBF7073577.1 2OG-Fe(II) oxygenase [Glaciecola sp. MH2013]
MWLNKSKVSKEAMSAYRKALSTSVPRHVIIDNLFATAMLDQVVEALSEPHHWQTQQHTYSALYVDDEQWQGAIESERFVKRDRWIANKASANSGADKLATEFLAFLRSNEFMSFLSTVFKVHISDLNLADPKLNSNYFRLKPGDFVNEHADDSPGREICMLLYLNKAWCKGDGGELVFSGKDNELVNIPPVYNRCVLFDPSSEGSEHWVNAMASSGNASYRYNVTSWYWTE